MKRIFFFLCLLGIVACKKEGAKTIDPGYDYYPAGLFSEWEYAVDSIVLNDFTISTDTYKFYIKERLEERMQNGNSISVRVQQYRRASDSESWSAGKSKAFVLSDRHVEELDNNLRTYSLIF
ncbi:MAG: hypothetical protein KDC37_03005, partial [Flavobacteriales bacterium]|nr:hypothetical protein [Flavobacteriales bacterium]